MIWEAAAFVANSGSRGFAEVVPAAAAARVGVPLLC